MEKNHNERINVENADTPQDAIMNRVNQTFDQMVEDVKNLINKNTEESNIK
ncbi:MAG TPA: hypothetical protein VEY51_07715 [Chondromyces sp.]|nr:hypothetical protein [Chondromyces sp.]